MTHVTLRYSMLFLTFFIINIHTQAQEAISDSPLTGSWEVVKLEWPNDTTLEKQDDSFLGNRWHFISEDKLILENEKGRYLIPYHQIRDILYYYGGASEISKQNDEHFELSVTMQGKLIVAHFSPSESLPEAKQEALLQLGKQEKVGAFYTQGVYCKPDVPWNYTCYRFYPDSTILQFSVRKPIAEVLSSFNKGAVIIKDDVEFKIASNTATYSYKSINFFTRKGHNKSKKSTPVYLKDTIYYQNTYHFSSVDDSLFINKKMLNLTKKRDSQIDLEAGFYPSNKLVFWDGDISKDEKEGLPENDFLLPSFIHTTTFNVVEEMPRFPGCEDKGSNQEKNHCATNKLLQYVYTKIKYPIAARVKGTEGTVVITFIIENDGHISAAKIVRDIDHGCGEAALSVVNQMIVDKVMWTPGKQNGKPVRVQFNLPVKFKLESSAPQKMSRRQRRRN